MTHCSPFPLLSLRLFKAVQLGLISDNLPCCPAFAGYYTQAIRVKVLGEAKKGSVAWFCKGVWGVGTISEVVTACEVSQGGTEELLFSSFMQ